VIEQLLVEIDNLKAELAEARNILKQCLSMMPVGYIPTHTVENLPEMIGDLAKALAEETTEREKLERELAAANQIMGELCESCGWAMRFPDQPCRCELEAALAAVKGGNNE
jgi:predicted RNase H-like nuclease (RuvC/YqgF family)